MSRRLIASLGLALVAAGAPAHAADRPTAPAPGSSRASPPRDRVPLPCHFETNRGQFEPGWDFFARCRGYSAWIRSGEIVLDAGGRAFALRLAGAREVAPDTAAHATAATASYFLGDDPSRWVARAPLTTGATYRGAAPATTWVASVRDRRLEFAFEMDGAAEPVFRLDGWGSLRVDESGALRAETAAGVVTLSAPVAWQDDRGTRSDVSAAFELEGDGLVRVALGARDASQPTFVDPSIDFLSYLGGSAADEYVLSADYDSNGRLFLAGGTRSTNFPATTGAYQTTKKQDNSGFTRSDVFVAKVASDGRSLSWCTYLGGDAEDSVVGMRIDGSGRPVVACGTSATNYPTTSGVIGPTNSSGNGVSGLTRLASDGASLSWSTYVPSFYGTRMALGPNGDVYLATSAEVKRINSAATAVSWTKRITPTSSIGSQSSSISGIAVDASDNCHVAGTTNQTNFTMTAGTLRTTLAGQRDAWVTKLDPLAGVLWQTLVGGTGDDYCQGLAIDPSGRPVVVGYTTSTDFPTSSDAYATTRPQAQGAFVARLNTGGTALAQGTYFGGGYDSFSAVAVHASGAVVCGGSTSATTAFPLRGAFQSTNAGQSDGILVAFDSGCALAFSSFLGTTSSDAVAAAAFAPDGTVAAAGGAVSLDLATTPVNAFQSTRPGAGDAWFLQVADALEGSANAPAVTTTSLPPWTVGVGVTGAPGLSFAATSGTSPYTWSVAQGSLPSGVSLGSDGALTGVPTSDSAYTITVQARDAHQVRGRRQLTWTVNRAPSVTTASLPDWTRTVPYLQTLAGVGGTGTLSWRVSAGSLPSGLSMTTAGQIGGTPTAVGTSAFTVEAKDVNGATATRDFTVRIAQVPAVGTAAPPEWTEGRPYNFTFGATGGTGALAWSVSAGELPVATPIDAAAGKLTGLAKAAGDYAFTVRATDVRGAHGDRAFQVRLNAAPSIATANLPFAVVGRAYASQLDASGGTAPRLWDLEAGLLPVGVVLQPQTGRVAGTPVAPAAGQLTFSYGDAAGAAAQRAIYFECAEILDLTTKRAVTAVPVSVTGPTRDLRCLELVGGSRLDVSVAGGGAAGQGPSLRFYAADGSETDLGAVPGASLRVTPKGAKLKGFVVPSTGRWFLAVEAANGFQGTMKVTTTLTPPARWTGTVAVDGSAPPAEIVFTAAPGSAVVVGVKPAKKSAAKPVIAALRGPGGEDLLAGGAVRTKGTAVTFTTPAALAAGEHRLSVGAAAGTSGDVVYTVTLKAPKTFDFEMPDLPAGDAE